jgi:hypothetical protein
VSRTRLVADLQAVFAVVAGSVLLAAPAGLLWSALAPRVHLVVTTQGIDAGDLESDKAFIGADGTYFLLMLGMGMLCGLLAWWAFRRSGPVTVLALVVGGTAAALIAVSVGLMPGAQAAVDAVSPGTPFRGHIDLYLGRLQKDRSLSMRSSWAFVAWPAGACIAFLAAALRRPQDLDLPPQAPMGST